MAGFNNVVHSIRSHDSLSSLSSEELGAPGVSSGSREKRKYVLIRLEDNGEQHLATDEDADELSLLLSPADVPCSPALSLERYLDPFDDSGSESCSDAGTSPLGGAVRASPTAQYQKPGGPCDHCGAVGEYLENAFSLRSFVQLHFLVEITVMISAAAD
eukprot:gene27054-33284_t